MGGTGLKFRQDTLGSEFCGERPPRSTADVLVCRGCHVPAHNRSLGCKHASLCRGCIPVSRRMLQHCTASFQAHGLGALTVCAWHIS